MITTIVLVVSIYISLHTAGGIDRGGTIAATMFVIMTGDALLGL